MMKEFVTEHIGKVLGVLAVGVLAWLGTMSYFFCHLLDVNAIYCDPLIVRIQFFLIVGALISVALRRFSKLVFGLALVLLFVLPIVSRFTPLPRAPEGIIEFWVVAPFQAAVGVIVAEILICALTYFDSVLKPRLSKSLGIRAVAAEPSEEKLMADTKHVTSKGCAALLTATVRQMPLLYLNIPLVPIVVGPPQSR
jgi:hypothetical protein